MSGCPTGFWRASNLSPFAPRKDSCDGEILSRSERRLCDRAGPQELTHIIPKSRIQSGILAECGKCNVYRYRVVLTSATGAGVKVSARISSPTAIPRRAMR